MQYFAERIITEMYNNLGEGFGSPFFLLTRELATLTSKSQYSVNESQYTEFNLLSCRAKMTQVGLQCQPI